MCTRKWTNVLVQHFMREQNSCILFRVHTTSIIRFDFKPCSILYILFKAGFRVVLNRVKMYWITYYTKYFWAYEKKYQRNSLEMRSLDICNACIHAAVIQVNKTISCSIYLVYRSIQLYYLVSKYARNLFKLILLTEYTEYMDM